MNSHDGKQIVQAVFQRRAREHEREWGAQALMIRDGLRLPVLDALALVENDQIPPDIFDGQDVAQDLLVVADREEARIPILCAALCGAAQHDLAITSGEPLDLAAPLRL